MKSHMISALALVSAQVVSAQGLSTAMPLPPAPVTPTVVVTKATVDDLPALKADRDAYTRAKDGWAALSDYAQKQKESARGSEVYRTTKITELEAILANAPRKPLIIAEGDSITAPVYSWATLHAAMHPDIGFVNMAVGGSDIDMMTARQATLLAKRPTEVWILIGANNMPDANVFLTKLWKYVDRLRADNIKVYVGTILPQKDRPEREAQRKIANAGIIANASAHGATVINFHADPRYGDWEDASDATKYGDGVHPGMAIQRAMQEAIAGVHDKPGYVVSPTLEGGPGWIADFDINLGLRTTGTNYQLYDTNKGAFRFVCGGAAKLVKADPIIYPAQPDASHLHQIWGNSDFTAFSNDNTNRVNSVTDCNDTAYSLNRSLYWQPALINDQGEALKPNLSVVYYKQWAENSAPCTPGDFRYVGKCLNIPNNIRFIMGWDYTKPLEKAQNATWYCSRGENNGSQASGAHYTNLDDIFKNGCIAGDTLTANTLGPNCWDGKYLDTPDHRSHVGYAVYRPNGQVNCNPSHPYTIPQQENKVQWTVTADMYTPDGKSRIRLSSDRMVPNALPGSTLHADYWEGWEKTAKALWYGHCIQKRLSCNSGNLGNGTALIGAMQPAYGMINPNPREKLQ